MIMNVQVNGQDALAAFVVTDEENGGMIPATPDDAEMVKVIYQDGLREFYSLEGWNRLVGLGRATVLREVDISKRESKDEPDALDKAIDGLGALDVPEPEEGGRSTDD